MRMASIIKYTHTHTHTKKNKFLKQNKAVKAVNGQDDNVS